MVIRYLDFYNNVLDAEQLNSNSYNKMQELNASGFEILYDQKVLFTSFRGILVDALDVLTRNDKITQILPQSVFWDFYNYVDVCSKQNNTLTYIITLTNINHELKYQYNEVKKEMMTYTNLDQLKAILNALDQNIRYKVDVDYIDQIKRVLERK